MRQLSLPSVVGVTTEDKLNWLIACVREIELASHDRILDDEGVAAASSTAASNLATETAARIAADALKADITYVDAQDAAEVTARNAAIAPKADKTYVDSQDAAEAAARAAADALLAPKNSPALTGTPTAPTATAGTNTDQIATTAFVQAASKWTDVFKTSDQNLAISNTTFQDVSGLSFAMAANTSYHFEAEIIVTSPASGSSGGGIKLSVNGPASPTSMHFAGTINGTDGTAYDTIVVDVNAQPAQYTMVLAVRGVINNGVNAGSLIVRASQRSAQTGVTVILKGSFIRYAVVQ